MVEVNDFLLVCAFRYSIGRATYAVGVVADDLVRLAPVMSRNDRVLVIREINQALRDGISMDMDRDQWIQVRDAMTQASSDGSVETTS